MIEDLTSGTTALVSGLLGQSQDVLTGIAGLTGGSLGGLFESLLSFRYIMVYYFQQAINYATNMGSVLKDYIGDAISGVQGSITGVVSSLTQKMIGLVSSMRDTILSTVNGLISKVTGLITGVANNLLGFKDMVSGLFSGINLRLTDITGLLFNPEMLINLITKTLLAVW